MLFAGQIPTVQPTASDSSIAAYYRNVENAHTELKGIHYLSPSSPHSH